MSDTPAFLRELRTLEHSLGWVTPCPDQHASAGFAVLVRPDERAGRYRFECLEARNGDACGAERELVRLLGLSEAEIRLESADEIEVVPLAEFAGAEEEGAEALLGTSAEVVLPGNGLQEVRDFLGLIDDVRRLADRPLTVLLIHHENKGGKVSGAWEGAGDTLFHVQAQGQGRVRLYVQKARWASSYHATTLHLRWAEGEGFELEEGGPSRPERTWDEIAEFVLANGGTSWKRVEAGVVGNGDYLRQRRDQMLADGVLVNVSRGQAFEIWHRDDPARPPTLEEPRPGSDTVADTVVSTTRDGLQSPTVSPCPPYRGDTVRGTRSRGAFEVDQDDAGEGRQEGARP